MERLNDVLWKLRLEGALNSPRLQQGALMEKIWRVSFGMGDKLTQIDIRDLEKIWRDLNASLKKMGEAPVVLDNDRDLLEATKVLYQVKFSS